MKKLLFLFKLVSIILALALFLCAAAYADEETPQAVKLAQTASGRNGAYVTELSEGWKFGGKDLAAEEEDFDDSLWSTVNLPHTWNTLDGADGGSNYSKTTYWYRKAVEIDASFAGKRVYLEFLGANQKTSLYVNGKAVKLCNSSAYIHKGGYTAFRFDITDALRTGSNTFAVKVNNSWDEEIAPLMGDFNMYGGIYRRVYLIAVNDVHVDLADSGSSGLFLTTPNVRSKERPDDLGKLNIFANIVNQGKESRQVTVTAHIEGDNAPEDISRTLSIPADGSASFDEDAYISNPHLWKGVDYSGKTDGADVGYRYTVTLTIRDGDEIIDIVSDKVGFRYFYVDKDTGFYLNGESYPLRGVNRHQYKEGMGSAITELEHEEDIELIMELGANTIRLCHYPHTDYFYDLCDENGIILWTEIPLVNAVGTAEEFAEVTKVQLTELIRQQYNRPSICFWGLENEVADNERSSYITAKKLLSELDAIVHELDGTGRYTTQAIHRDPPMDQNDTANLEDDDGPIGWKSDLLGWNVYTGWYAFYEGTFGEFIDGKAAQDSRPLAISEYGWGGSTVQHEPYPELWKNGLSSGGKWHPEEYQNLMHEEAIAYINEHDSLWATYVWVMFDFDVDSRDEGSRVAQNDKGLVSNDRKTKKDSFYLYKANWNMTEPFVHITSSRYTKRDTTKTYVKVYSNCGSVRLYRNGELIGDMADMGNGIFMLEDVGLVIGENKLHAVGVMEEETCEDACVWTRSALSSTDLASDLLPVNLMAHTITLDRLITVGEFRKSLRNEYNAKCQIMSNDEEVTDENAVILVGMTVLATSENGANTSVYRFVSQNMFTGEGMKATSAESGNWPNKAVDSNDSTRWVASNNTYPQSITADLGDAYYLGTLSIDWYKDKDRHYTYTIEVSQDDRDYVTVVDRSNNTIVGTTTDDLRMMKGRYIRVNILSCSNSRGYAAMHEMRIDCWMVDSPVYEIDTGSMLIIVPNTEGLTVEAFVSNLITDGCFCTVQTETGYVDEGTQVSVTNLRGRTYTYIVTAEREPKLYFTDLALNKKVYFSSEEGWSQKTGEDTHATNVNDGLMETAWVASTSNYGIQKKGANYPEWVCVDLGKEYSIKEITLQFETKDERIYQFQVYSSSNAPFSRDGVVPSDYKLIIDQSENDAFENGYYVFSGLEDAKARYITVMVLGNSLYPENSYAAAGIYDLKVYGKLYVPSDTETE